MKKLLLLIPMLILLSSLVYADAPSTPSHLYNLDDDCSDSVGSGCLMNSFTIWNGRLMGDGF